MSKTELFKFASECQMTPEEAQLFEKVITGAAEGTNRFQVECFGIIKNLYAQVCDDETQLARYQWLCRKLSDAAREIGKIPEMSYGEIDLKIKEEAL